MGGKEEHLISAADEGILQQVQPQRQLPFVLLHKSGFTASAVLNVAHR